MRDALTKFAGCCAGARSTDRRVVRALAKTYPDVECALTHESAYQLVVATILSAQCTDERVNMTTPALFAKYPTAADLARSKQNDVEKLVKSTGFFEKSMYAFTIYGACITPSLVAALLWKRATPQGAIASICSGAVVTLAWNEVPLLHKLLPSGLADLDAVLPAISLSVTMLVVVSLLTQRPTPTEKT